ncbi:hypothetical protein DNTS_009912 [Danionella cerebrum]|uniref:Knl1 C-terminal RWD domain-containing protein n=1 Tax=Danionella cerebrum TaxID=2873325 RepID=A0A553PUY5_9TELE|nr:hypothetical protein DNTS_009912 [Danionella translucida]
MYDIVYSAKYIVICIEDGAAELRILKTSRASMKVVGVEQEQQKEETAKPVEKKRNSRRVSFATTNNVRVFTKTFNFNDGSHQFKGFEALLNTPLYLSQHKENFFSDPVFEDDCVDRTVLLGDDTGYMDMTQSNTITIHKDYESNELLSSEPAQSSCLKRLQSEEDAEMKNPSTHSDFLAFLTSLNLPTGNTAKLRKTENQPGNIFHPDNTNICETDKENHIPCFFNKPHPDGKVDPQQPKGLQCRGSSVSLVEGAGTKKIIAPTTNPTILVECKETSPAQSSTSSACENVGGAHEIVTTVLDPEDMEFTLNQTAGVSVDFPGNIPQNAKAAVKANRSHCFPEHDTMEITRGFNVSMQNKDHTMSRREQAQPPVPKIRRMSRTDQTTDEDIKGNFSIGQATRFDAMENKGAPFEEMKNALFCNDMDMTLCHTFVQDAQQSNTNDPVTNSKNAFCSSDMAAMLTLSEPRKLSLTQTPHCSNIERKDAALDAKLETKNKPFRNPRNSLALVSVSRTVREDEVTETIKEDSLCPTSNFGKMPSCSFVSDDGKIDQKPSRSLDTNSDDVSHCGILEAKTPIKSKPFSHLRNSLPLVSVSRALADAGDTRTLDEEAQYASLDEMEMTQCQTIVLEAKPPITSKPFSNLRNSLPLVPVFRAVEDAGDTRTMEEEARHASLDEMEMTQCQTIVLEAKPPIKNKPFSNLRNSLPLVSVSRAVEDAGDTRTMEEEARHASLDEMEMTRCQTIVLEAKPPIKNMLFSNLRNSLPLVSVSRAVEDAGDTRTMEEEAQHESLDEMEMTQCQTIVLEAKPPIKNKPFSNLRSSLALVSRAVKDEETRVMEDEEAQPASSDKMEITPCQTILETKQVSGDKSLSIPGKNWPYTSVSRTSTRIPASYTSTQFNDSDCMDLTCQASTFAETSQRVSDEMEFTACTTIPTLIHFRRDLNGTRQSAISADQTINLVLPMEFTGTVVMEPEKCKREIPFNRIGNSPNVESTFSCPDGMEITQPQTGNILLNTFSNEAKMACKKNKLPAAESCLKLCQPSTSNLLIPSEDDDIEQCASTSLTRGTVSNEEGNEVNEAAKSAASHGFHSNTAFDLDGKASKFNNTGTIFCRPPEEHVDMNCQTAMSRKVLPTDEDNKVLTTDFSMELSGSFKHREESDTKTFNHQEVVRELSSNEEKTINSKCSLNESFADSIKENIENAKAWRRSLAEFQIQLHNMSQKIQQEQTEMIGSKTAPLPLGTVPDSSATMEQCETGIFKETASIVTPVIKKQNNSIQNEKPTPFSLKKKSFSSRMSLCGIVPKLTKRATTVTTNKTVTLSTNDVQCLQLEKHFVIDEQNSMYETFNIHDEKLPEMSSEEDLSGILENCPISVQEQDDSFLVPTKEHFQDGVSESATCKSPQAEEETHTTNPTKGSHVSDTGPDCHEEAVKWEGNFIRHTAQDSQPKAAEDTGVSESSLRCSQFDSHMDTELDDVLILKKKLDDGCITVNEFFTYVGINFMFHRPRPSSLPEIHRARETRNLEDLLREKYIHLPNQRVYEQDCKNLTEMVERLKEQMSVREKSLRSVNKALQHELRTLSEEHLKSFRSKLRERRVYFGKRSKALSHEMKGVLYSELIKTTQNAKLSLVSKIEETNETMEDLDGCINDLEADLHRLNSAITDKEREIGELGINLKALRSQEEKLKAESSNLNGRLATFNSLNEWRLDMSNEKGALFTFLHKTIHLQVNLKEPAAKEWISDDLEQNMEVCFQLLLNVNQSECHASMVHHLIALNIQPQQIQWAQRVRVVFSSLKAFKKFELSLAIPPDYPFGVLQLQDFKSHTGETRVCQIEDIITSVEPAKNYLTKILKKIHDEVLL